MRLTDSVRAGTLVKDIKDVLETPVKFNTFRLAVSVNDAKFMVGNDRIGVQYKNNGPVNEVTRLTYRWGDDKIKPETMLEKNASAMPLGTIKAMGLPVKVELVPGLRQNLTGSRTVTPSANLDASFKINGLKLKVSIEARQSGS